MVDISSHLDVWEEHGPHGLGAATLYGQSHALRVDPSPALRVDYRDISDPELPNKGNATTQLRVCLNGGGFLSFITPKEDDANPETVGIEANYMRLIGTNYNLAEEEIKKIEEQFRTSGGQPMFSDGSIGPMSLEDVLDLGRPVHVLPDDIICFWPDSSLTSDPGDRFKETRKNLIYFVNFLFPPERIKTILYQCQLLDGGEVLFPRGA